METHSEGVQIDKFCALRADSCKHPDGSKGNKYRNNCKPTNWSEIFFYQGRKKEVKKVYEAHHLLCVASVTQFLANNSKLHNIIKQTQWCINAKANMHAMPLWGHTIQYYCDIETSDLKIEDRLLLKKNGPSFKNIPQHDYDHNSTVVYKREVDNAVKDIAKAIEKKKDNHEEAIKDLKDALNDLSKHFKDELNRRGKERCGGTHKAWQNARKGKAPNWYEPFSMADDGNEEKRTFPLSADKSDDKLANKIEKLVKAFGLWG